MTQEEKELLVKDLCGRIGYRVKFHYTKHPESFVDTDSDDTVNGYYLNLVVGDNQDYCIERCKPYLRQMSSMTEEEKEEYELLANHCISTSIGFIHLEAAPLIDWLNEHHFDYNGLIEKGLAFEAPEGMYKN